MTAVPGSEPTARDFSEFFLNEYTAVVRAVYVAGWDIDTAEECAQEAFIRAFVRWSRLSDHGWATGWIIRTAINRARRISGRENRKRGRLPAMEATFEPDAEAGIDVRSAIAELPWKQQSAIVLFYLQDLPVREVARLMHCSQGAVKTHLSRARAGLKRDMEEVS